MDEQDLSDSQFPPSTVPTPSISSTSLTQAVQDLGDSQSITEEQKEIPKDFPEFPYGFPKFYENIYELLNDPSTDSFISWSKSNRSFVVTKLEEELVLKEILRRCQCTSFKKFLKRLKHYGFKKVKRCRKNVWLFRNENFVRGQPELMVEMHRRVMISKALKITLKSTLKILSRIKTAKAVELLDHLQNLRI